MLFSHPNSDRKQAGQNLSGSVAHIQEETLFGKPIPGEKNSEPDHIWNEIKVKTRVLLYSMIQKKLHLPESRSLCFSRGNCITRAAEAKLRLAHVRQVSVI